MALRSASAFNGGCGWPCCIPDHGVPMLPSPIDGSWLPIDGSSQQGGRPFVGAPNMVGPAVQQGARNAGGWGRCGGIMGSAAHPTIATLWGGTGPDRCMPASLACRLFTGPLTGRGAPCLVDTTTAPTATHARGSPRAGPRGRGACGRRGGPAGATPAVATATTVANGTVQLESIICISIDRNSAAERLQSQVRRWLAGNNAGQPGVSRLEKVMDGAC
jgi:hypothetical protein